MAQIRGRLCSEAVSREADFFLNHQGHRRPLLSVFSPPCDAGAWRGAASGQVPSQQCGFNSKGRAGPADWQMMEDARVSFCSESVELCQDQLGLAWALYSPQEKLKACEVF